MDKQERNGFTIVPYPRSRLLVADAVRAGKRKPLIHGLIQVDVTEPRRLIREHEARTGEKVSFTAFVVHCVGAAVAQEPMIHAYKDWCGRLVMFDDVDVNTIVEVIVEGRSFPMVRVLRATNRRSVRELHEEIRAAQAGPTSTYSANSMTMIRWYARLPSFIRDMLYEVMLKSPHRLKQIGGTVNLTAVGMFGVGGGWGIPLPLYTLGITLGGISWKPTVIDGAIVPREIMDVTLSFDHDIVDGAPAARFANRLKGLIESGHGLEAVLKTLIKRQPRHDAHDAGAVL